MWERKEEKEKRGRKWEVQRERREEVGKSPSRFASPGNIF